MDFITARSAFFSDFIASESGGASVNGGVLELQ
jgi:hypothetical protein